MRPDTALVDRLKNRGPVTLSSDNPYLAANLLLSREMAASPELTGFVSHRGTPAAIAVEKQIFSNLVLHFYYLDKPEHYILEDTQGLWIISAPQSLRSDEERAIRNTQNGDHTSAAILSASPSPTTSTSKTENSPVATSTLPAQSSNIPSSVATPLVIASISSNSEINKTSPNISTSPTALNERGFKSLPKAESPTQFEITPRPTKSSTPAAVAKTPVVKPTISSSQPQQPPLAKSDSKEAGIVESVRAKTSSDLAEITPRGDLVHYVTSDAETLDLITLWYTLDRTNAGRVARVNNLGSGAKLNVGDTLVIPAYLLRNKSRMSEAATKGLREALPELSPHRAVEETPSAAPIQPTSNPLAQNRKEVTPKSLGSEVAEAREKHK